MITIENTEITFSFNKASIGNPSIPPWTIKAKGETHYCWHVSSSAPWSTKETPSNPHTKGSIKFKHANLRIDEGCATISPAKEAVCSL